MNRKNFVASNWFSSAEQSTQYSPPREKTVSKKLTNPNYAQELAPFINPQQTNESQLGQYFVPGWKGESLFSKNLKKFSQILNKFQHDAKKYLLSNDTLSRKLKISIYNDFLSYSEFKALNCTKLDHYLNFWKELQNDQSNYKDEINRFIDILSFRVAVVYLLKVRFILTLQKKTSTQFDIKNIFYPNSYFTKVFKTASSTEILTKAFESNVFSWYRPNESLKKDLLEFKDICFNLKITEIVKTISITSESILNEKTDYSHSISHKNFGLFINSILINFPIWLDSIKKKNTHSFLNNKTGMEIISTKFAGDNLESLAVSHWLAQYENMHIKWDQIICPDFKRGNFDAGFYLKIINELQFLNFLAEISHSQGHEPKSFISNVINSHLYNRKNSNSLQKSLLGNDSSLNESTYDRVFLNLHNYPKNNPQHFLFTKILSEAEFIKEKGFLYILTSKKLFVPSQKNKIDNLLKQLKVEGIFNFDGVTGKGEIGSYLYIFSKKCQLPTYSDDDREKKQACLNFRFTGQLESFQEFSSFTKLGQDFFNSHLSDLPAMYHMNQEHCRLEFYQDAIVNGQLIHSTNKDASNVTHPLFFKKLMSICNPLDFYFELQTVDFEEKNQEEDNSLFNFSQSFKREKSNFIIIVDKRLKTNIKLEVISVKSLEAKAYEYGHALCSYFYAYPKWPNTNIQSIKEFLGSNIGQQIVNLTFSNEVRKVKGNLSKLLIPKYFVSQEQIPTHVLQGLKLLKMSAQELLSVHPNEITSNYEQINSLLPELVQSYPAHTLGLLANFKSNIFSAIDILGCQNKSTAINFNNPILKSPLVLSKTYPIYPDNKDVFIEFNTNDLETIHSDITKIKRKTEQKDGYTSHKLEIYSNDKIIISLYSEDHMISFLDFLFKSLIGISVSKSLQSINVPKLEDLNSILNSYQSIGRSLNNLSESIPQDYNHLINKTIFGQ